MDKVIITVAPTGLVTSKEANPYLPMTPDEIANDAYQCWKAGAAVVHIHVRDKNGDGTMNKEIFKETVHLVKSKCDLVINLTTSGGGFSSSDEERMAHLRDIKPEMASFDAGSMNWPSNMQLFVNSPKFLEQLAKVDLENGIKPEMEIFDAGMIHATEYFMKKGLVARPPHYQFVLGNKFGANATVETLVYLRSLLPPDATWSAFGIGRGHIPVMYATIALGGHVRVGLEDNIYYSKGRLATNVELVERAVRLVKEANKEAATPDEARQILHLRGRN